MKLKFNKAKISILLVLLITLRLGFAQAEEKPTNVYVGIYLNQIYALSLKDNQFSVDFYIWFRWQGNDVKPLESFELMNGRIESRDGAYEDTMKGLNYAFCRVIATITKFWDISRFPLDNHTLTIEIEDSENEDFKLKYIADKENCGINPQIQVPGWQVSTVNTAVVGHTYKTNYGDITLPTDNESVYSRFIFSVDITRPGLGYFLKLFFTVFIASMIALVALFIKPTDLDPRFGLGAGALFAAVASQVVIASLLPDTNIITLTDKLHIIAIFFIFLSLVESVVSLRYISTGREALSQRLDRTCFYLFLLGYVVLNLWVILLK